MLWIKAFHLVFMVTWFAGLFYLPRLFVYHAMSEDSISIERFKLMERKLFYGIATPGCILTLLFGFWLLKTVGWDAYSDSYWLSIKLFFILLLIGYHVYCGKLMVDFKHDKNKHSHIWYRWFNEVPVIFLIVIIIMAVVKPF
ncbi:MAG: protoporphyrinogen oxidase HemJ [Gammaproteobacteria bacterium]